MKPHGNLGNGHGNQMVVQMDMRGSAIKVHPSSKIAAERTGTCRNSISACLHNKQYYAGGFTWKKYKE